MPPRPPGAPAWPTAPPSPRSRTDTAPSAAPRPGASWPRPPAPAAGPAPSRSCACAAPRPPCATGNGVRRRPPGRSPATHLCAGDGGPGRGRLSPAARSQAVAPPLSAAQPGRGPGAAPLSTAAAALAWQPFLRLALLLSGVPHARAWGMDALSPGCGDLSVPGFAPFCQDSCLLLLPRLSASVYSPRSWAGLSPAGRQAPTKAAPSLPSSAGQGREEARKGSWVERRTGRQHSPMTVTGKTDSTRAKDRNLLPSTSEEGNEKENLTLQTPSPEPALLPGLNFTPDFPLPPPPERRRGTGNGACAHFITPCLCRSSLLTLFPCSSGGSLPRETVLHELLQREAFPRAAVLHKLLQRGGSQLLPANLLHRGLLSPRGHRPCQEPAPAGASHRATASFGHIRLLRPGLLHGLQVDICSTVDLCGLQGDLWAALTLPSHGCSCPQTSGAGLGFCFPKEPPVPCTSGGARNH